MDEMVSTRIDLPRDMVDLLERQGEAQGFTLAQQILVILKTYLENYQDPILKADDPILHIAGAMSSGVGDLSVHHDRYLYGKSR
jgi:hypothetical protein